MNPTLRSVLVTLAVLLVAYVGYRLIGAWAERAIVRVAHRGGAPGAEHRARSLWSVGRRLVFIMILLATLVVIMSIWGVSSAALVAVAGSVGVAVGLGAQGLVRDMIAGFYILAENQFNIGDQVTITGVEGEVIDIQPRVTVLRDRRGRVYYVPNGSIVVSINKSSSLAPRIVSAADEDPDQGPDSLPR
jgi:small conductance mechanosensitive channel